MKHRLNKLIRRSAGAGLLCLLALSSGLPAARAGLTVDIHLYHDTYGYYFYPWLNANTNTPGFPDGNYLIASPQIPNNGSQLQYQATNNTLSYATGGGNYYSDFNSFLYGITNGHWSIWVTNSTSTNQYQFTVTVAGVTSNSFDAPVVAVFPTNGAPFVTNQPSFQWTGPANWAGTLNVNDNLIDTNGNYNYEASATLPPNQTFWPCPVVLPDGTNDFNADYTSNVTAQIVASTPLDNASQPISAWTSTATLETSYDSIFTVGSLGSPILGNLNGGHTNIAYYSFEDDNLFAHDFSGNGNNIGGYGWVGSAPYMTNDAEAGSYAVGYTGSGWQSPPTNLVATLAGSFSVSLWAKTTNNPDNDSDPADVGAGLLCANSDQVIPMAQTGNKLAFLTGGGTPDTLHSATSINTGSYVHLVVTRDQATGEKNIYVNGSLDASDFGATGQLNTGLNPTLFLGMNSTNSSGFIGEMDEVQIYSGVLSASDVTYLYNNPGTNVANISANSQNLNAALGTINLNWATNGDTSWFVETTNTYNSAPSAAQSGSVTNAQSSVLSTTVAGPGTLTFYWSSIANDPNGGFDYQFAVDGTDMNDFRSGVHSWVQAGPYTIPAGSHTLSWNVYANNDTDPTQAGYLDQVSWTPVYFVQAADSPTNGASPLTVRFTVAAVDSSGNAITNWSWDFGDGTGSSVQNPTHTYTTVGTFTPILTAINALGAVPTTSGLGLITATSIIKATASPAVGKAPLTVQFNSPAADSTGVSITKWNWNFGDGAGSSAQNPSHTYSNVGSFKPSLTTLNGSGQTPLTEGPGVITATQHSPTNVVKNLPGSAAGFTYNNFSNTKSLQFLGNATNVTTADGAVLQLTPPAIWQDSAAFTAVPIPFGPHVGFSTFFTFRLSKPGIGVGGETNSNGVLGGDGIVFLIQSAGYVLGITGGGMGYLGISNSLAVEFDTFNDGTMFGNNPGDRNGNHVAVNFNGVLSDAISVPITTPMDNGNVWYAWIDYEGVSQDLEVRLSEIPVRPLAPTLDTTVDLPAILGTTNAFVGFTSSTGTAWNEQDILAWKFMALPTKRITGVLTLGNGSQGLQITKGMVLMRNIYAVAGVTYTNFTYAPFNTVSNANAQIAFATGIAELNPANPVVGNNNVDIAVSNNAAAIDSDVAGINQFAMLGAYTNSGPGDGGAAVNYDSGDYTQFGPYYANTGWPPFNMNEQSYNTIQDQVAANPPPGLFPPAALTQLQITDPNYSGPPGAQWISPGGNGDVQGDTVSYSLGTLVGTMTVREQVVASPPAPIIISSPRSDGTNFVFNFSTVLSQSYTIWANANLATTNWISYTNLIGDGYFQEITIPLTNSTQSFFQLTSP